MAEFVRSARLAGFQEKRTRRLRLILLACMAPVALAGCHRGYSGYPFFNTDGYRYRAGAAVVGPDRDTLRVAVVVVNESNQQRVIGLARCPMWGEIVKAQVAASGRNWSSEVYEQRQHVVPHDSTGKPIMEVCAASLPAMTFPPGARVTSVLKVPVREILGDSLPSRRYRVTARLISNGGDGRKLDAGEVFLCNCEVRATNQR